MSLIEYLERDNWREVRLIILSIHQNFLFLIKKRLQKDTLLYEIRLQNIFFMIKYVILN